MLNVFPQSVGDVDLGLKTYKALIDGYPDALVVEACKRFLMGKVPGQNKAFAPSLPQFIEELDAMIERDRLQARKAELMAKFGDELRERNGGDWDQPYTLPPRIRQILGGANANQNG